MFDNLYLNPNEVTKAADHILFLLGVFLCMALVVALRATTMPALGAESDASFQERTAIRTKLLAGILLAPAIIVLFALSGDILRLSVTFPMWGTFVVALMLLIIWIVCRFLFLTRDDIGDYTIEAEHRRSIDTRWEIEKAGKIKLRRELVGWSAGIIVAIVWLMVLAHLDAHDVVKIFTS